MFLVNVCDCSVHTARTTEKWCRFTWFIVWNGQRALNLGMFFLLRRDNSSSPTKTSVYYPPSQKLWIKQEHRSRVCFLWLSTTKLNHCITGARLQLQAWPCCCYHCIYVYLCLCVHAHMCVVSLVPTSFHHNNMATYEDTRLFLIDLPASLHL